MKRIIAMITILATAAPAMAQTMYSRASVDRDVARVYQAADDFKVELERMKSEVQYWSSERRTEALQVVREATADWQRCGTTNPSPICAEGIVERLRAWRLRASR